MKWLTQGMFAAALALATTAQSATTVPSLCRSDEKIVFSCQTRKGTVSLCRAPEGNGPQLQYRFGVEGRIALAYPKNQAAPHDAFLADTLMYSGSGGAYVQFVHEAFRYTVFTAIGRWSKSGKAREVAGVAIAKDDKEAANLACVGPAASELGSELFTSLGMKAGEGGFDIPDIFTKN